MVLNQYQYEAVPSPVREQANRSGEWYWRRREWVTQRNLFPDLCAGLASAGIGFLILENWNSGLRERVAQVTDDACVRSELTPLSTKVAGLVADVRV
jgi:hypothetical protein